MALSERDRKLGDEYLIHGNMVKAALSAGYAESTANKRAHLWIGESRNDSLKPELFDYIQQKRQRIARSYEITQERLAAELAKIAFGDTKDLFNENGELRPIHELEDNVSATLASIEVQEVVKKGKRGKPGTNALIRKVKSYNKIEAISVLNKMMGYNAPEKHVHDAGPSFLDFLKASTAQPPKKEIKPVSKKKKPARGKK